MPTNSIVARLTPPGKSAIACLGVSGPRAWETVRALFRRPNQIPLPETPRSREIYFGALGEAGGGADEVILFVRQTAPIIVLEIDCHGGPEVVRLLESIFASRGHVLATASEWSNAIDGPERAEMLDILTRCPTTRTAGIALDQLHGACDRGLADPNVDAARLVELIAVGEHLVRPWKVVLAGAPNVGKSSLVNALAGYTRSIVSPTPGTTRDAVSTDIAVDGWPIELIDTAGLRETDDELESQGIARADAARAGADLVLWVLDATCFAPLLTTENGLVVVNKRDRPATWETSNFDLRVSAQTGEGIDALAAALVSRLVPRPPREAEGVPITRTQKDAARRRLTAR